MATFDGFQSLIETSPDAISLLNGQGEILYESPSAIRIFGYQPGEVIGKSWLDFIHPDDRDLSRRKSQHVLTNGSVVARWDARVRHKDGNYHWTENTFSSLVTETQAPTIMMQQRDITVRRFVDTERQQHAEDLAVRNLRLEEFAYTAAHDLREPLRAISLYTELLVQKTPQDDASIKAGKFIGEGVTRMAALIDDLLSFARTGVTELPQSVNLQGVLNQATMNLALAIEGSAANVTSGWLPTVKGNEIHLVRLFQNLISNSIKYRSLDPVEVHITAERRDGEWLIRIIDNGVGIAPQYHADIFLPFKRLVNHDVPGTGLGLSVCQKIVEEFGGSIWVESEPGAGSVFLFTIPAVPSGHRTGIDDVIASFERPPSDSATEARKTTVN